MIKIKRVSFIVIKSTVDKYYLNLEKHNKNKLINLLDSLLNILLNTWDQLILNLNYIVLYNCQSRNPLNLLHNQIVNSIILMMNKGNKVYKLIPFITVQFMIDCTKIGKYVDYIYKKFNNKPFSSKNISHHSVIRVE